MQVDVAIDVEIDVNLGVGVGGVDVDEVGNVTVGANEEQTLKHSPGQNHHRVCQSRGPSTF